MNRIVDLYLENDRLLKKGFRWENQLNRKFAALELTLKEKKADVERIKEMMHFMKQETSSLSYFRHNLLIISASLSMKEDAEETFRRAVSIYKKLKKAGFSSTQYLPHVASFLASEVDEQDVDNQIESAYGMYRAMKENNFWFTSADDHMMATLLAHSGVDISKAAVDMGRIYRYLNDRGIWRGNALQSMSHLLLISPEPIEKKADRLLKFRERLNDAKITLDSYSQSMIAILALVEKENKIDSTIAKIEETSKYLAKQDGFGNWTLGKGPRNMISIALVLSEDLDALSRESVHTTVQNSIQSLLLAQQAAMIAAMGATASAAASSGSSGGE